MTQHHLPKKNRPKPLYRAGYLQSLNFVSQTIIDIGVRSGTPPLFNAFPERNFVLVDPQREGEALLKSPPKQYVFKNVALGSAPTTLTLNDAGDKSSLFERTALTATRLIKDTYEVTVSTLDLIIDEIDTAGLLGVKIDAEGAEIDILDGLHRHADRIEFLICETSIRERFVGGYTFSQLVQKTHSKGLEFFNFLNVPQKQPRCYDCLFVRRGHQLFS